MSAGFPKRKRPATGVLHVDGQPTVIFDTVCTKEKNPGLNDDSVHHTLIQVWSHATAFLVGRYVIMPDHVHYFAWATDSEIPFQKWVTYWKSQFTLAHGGAELRFQSGNWDTRMRSENAYEEKWNYVRQNPIRAGLVTSVDDWPYQGVVHA